MLSLLPFVVAALSLGASANTPCTTVVEATPAPGNVVSVYTTCTAVCPSTDLLGGRLTKSVVEGHTLECTWQNFLGSHTASYSTDTAQLVGLGPGIPADPALASVTCTQSTSAHPASTTKASTSSSIHTTTTPAKPTTTTYSSSTVGKPSSTSSPKTTSTTPSNPYQTPTPTPTHSSTPTPKPTTTSTPPVSKSTSTTYTSSSIPASSSAPASSAPTTISSSASPPTSSAPSTTLTPTTTSSSATPTTSTPTTTLPDGFSTFAPCAPAPSPLFSDILQISTGDMTPEFCAGFCFDEGFDFAAVNLGSQCMCGNTFAVDPSTIGASDPSLCNLPCSGDSTQICGGVVGVQIYETNQTPTTPDALAPGYAPFGSTGCASDADRTIFMNPISQSTGTNTPATCTAFCAQNGLKYAGVQAGSECWCADSFTDASGPTFVDAPTNCNVTCTGAPGAFCGGSDAITLYAKN